MPPNAGKINSAGTGECRNTSPNASPSASEKEKGSPAAVFRVILVAPEIPPNTGNIIRLAANTGAALHLVKPLGFRVDDRDLKRAGMDYRERAVFRVHDDFPAALAAARGENPGARAFAVSPAGTVRHDAPRYRAGDIFVFGRESDGLPPDILSGFPPEQIVRIPMRPANRSINLSNAVAVVVMEAWRQLNFAGAESF